MPRMDIDRVCTETFIARAEHYATLGSTNDRAAELAAQATAVLPLLVVADEQTAGRGRGSNRWWTGSGSLALSVVFPADDAEPGQPKPSPLAGLAAAVAVVEAVRPLLPDHPLGLHWPNDVMVGDRKLAGVLVEVLSNRRLIVGIGLNVDNTVADAPAELRRPVATLRDLTGRRHDRTNLLIAVVKALEAARRTLAASPDQLGAAADRLCLQRGHSLRLRIGREIIEGRCAGIAADGGLLLDTDEGRQTFYTGTLDSR